MNTTQTIHVLPVDGHWAVMTQDRDCIKSGLATRQEAIKVAGQVAADDGKYAFMMIHTKDDLTPARPQ